MPEPEVNPRPLSPFLEVLAPGKEPNLDIVAVHGLNPTDDPSHAMKTWTAGDKMWLRDFLPNDLPNARIMLFGYNANVAFERSESGIRDQAEDLLNKLDLERLEVPDKIKRPIIFIAHSLGGLVVKKALVSGSSNNEFKYIVEATFGIAFFATPHQGSDIGKLGEIAAIISKEVNQNANDSLLESMKKDSLFSDELANDFRHHLLNYYFLSFYERRNSKETGCLIVDKRSSLVGVPGDREFQIPMEADHTSICKFASANSHNYKTVRLRLTQMAKNAALNLEKGSEEKNQTKPPAYSPSIDSSKLLEACSRGDMDDVRSFIKAGADVNFEDAKGNTALMTAIERENFELVKLLLSFDAKVNQGSDVAERTPLGIAIKNGSLEMVELLLDNKASPHIDSVHLSMARALPLGQAVFAGHGDIVKLLIERDADVNAIPQRSIFGWTPLHVALQKPSKDHHIVKCLLEHGAKIDKPSAKGETVVDCINGLKAGTKVAASKGLPLMPQLKDALSKNLFSEVAIVLVSEIHWGLRFGKEGKKYGKNLVIKYPDGRLHPLDLPLNLGPGGFGAASTSTGAHEMALSPGQYQLPQQRPPLATSLPMRSYTNPHAAGIHELSPQQHQPGLYQPPHMPYSTGNPPMRSYSDPHGAGIHELSPQQHQAGPYQPTHMQYGVGNSPVGSYISTQVVAGGPQILTSPATIHPVDMNLATQRYTSPQSTELGGAPTQWNQTGGQPSAYIGPTASNLVTRSYTSPQAAEVMGSTPEPSAVKEESKKKKQGGFLGRVKGKFRA